MGVMLAPLAEKYTFMRCRRWSRIFGWFCYYTCSCCCCCCCCYVCQSTAFVIATDIDLLLFCVCIYTLAADNIAVFTVLVTAAVVDVVAAVFVAVVFAAAVAATIYVTSVGVSVEVADVVASVNITAVAVCV